MIRTRLSLMLLMLALFALGSTAARSESGLDDPTAFFANLTNINPQASGKKVTGFVTIAYDFVEVPADQQNFCQTIWINNMFVVATMNYRKQTKPFNRDFTAADGTQIQPSFCFDDFQSQVNFVLGLIRQEVIPTFFGPCDAGSNCPSFEVKAIKQFLSSGEGAVSMQLRLAVHAKVPHTPDDDDDD